MVLLHRWGSNPRPSVWSQALYHWATAFPTRFSDKKLYHQLQECYIELEYGIHISCKGDRDITTNETLHVLVTKKLYHPLEECHIELGYDIHISYKQDHDITANELCIL